MYLTSLKLLFVFNKNVLKFYYFFKQLFVILNSIKIQSY